MTIGEWLTHAKLELAQIGAPAIEAEVLLGHALTQERPWLLAHSIDEFPDPSRANELLGRRLAREPLAYLTGSREFYGRRFIVSPAVLIPRQETETLVEAGLEAIDRGACRVLDLCSGSGEIGITLKLERPRATVVLADISPAANEIARRNAESRGVKVEVLESDLFETVPGKVHLIVCNPPYISRDASLEPEVAHHEPALALYADEQGYSVYRAIAYRARDFLIEGGELWLEVGDGMVPEVRAIFEGAHWVLQGSRFDLLGHERVVGFRVE